MSYLISQLWMCLLIAFILGVGVGYYLCKIWFCRNEGDYLQKEPANEPTAALTPVPSPSAAPVAAVAAPLAFDSAVDLTTSAYNIETLEGIGPKTGETLRGIGITNIAEYLQNLATPQQRQVVAEKLGFKIEPLTAWASMADLLRVEGVDHQFAELLTAAGLQSVSDLALSDATALTAKLVDVNTAGKQKIAPDAPAQATVHGWIATAGNMKPLVRV